jgi:hypothetical protein
MRKKLLGISAVIAISVVTFSTPVDAATPSKKLLWSQEFNEVAGTLPNSKYFEFELGGGGWGNKELQWYAEDAV